MSLKGTQAVETGNQIFITKPPSLNKCLLEVTYYFTFQIVRDRRETSLLNIKRILTN